jgi:hypothetical protein
MAIKTGRRVRVADGGNQGLKVIGTHWGSAAQIQQIKAPHGMQGPQLPGQGWVLGGQGSSQYDASRIPAWAHCLAMHALDASAA